MDLGSRVGTGNTAEIFALDADRVVKRFREQVPREAAEREVENTRAAVDSGLPVPAVHGLVAEEDGPAIVYERVRGPTMLSRLRARPWALRRYARRLARLHAQIHAVRPPDLRSVRGRLRERIREQSALDRGTRRRVLSKLESLPEGGVLCHGDFHPENVLLADDPIVIDWFDAGRGNPAADVARTSLLLRFAGRRARIHSVVRTLFRRWYLRFYTGQTDVDRSRIRDWELPVAAARLAEDVPEADRLRSFVGSRLGGQ